MTSSSIRRVAILLDVENRGLPTKQGVSKPFLGLQFTFSYLIDDEKALTGPLHFIMKR